MHHMTKSSSLITLMMMQRDLIAQIKLGMMFSLIEIITQLKKALEPSISNNERKMQEKS